MKTKFKSSSSQTLKNRARRAPIRDRRAGGDFFSVKSPYFGKNFIADLFWFPSRRALSGGFPVMNGLQTIMGRALSGHGDVT